MALVDNLVSYWKLDESSGNAADSVGSNTLTNNNTVTYSAGKINNGAVFNGSNNYLSRTTVTGMPTGAGARTWMYWFKLPNFSGTKSISGYTAAGARSAWEVICVSATEIGVDISGHYANITVPTMSTGVWYHLVITYSGSGNTFTGYLNGTAYTSNSWGFTPNTSVTGMWLGRTGYGYTAIEIDEVAFWTRALSAAEVSQLYNGGAGLQYPFIAPTIRRRRIRKFF